MTGTFASERAPGRALSAGRALPAREGPDATRLGALQDRADASPPVARLNALVQRSESAGGSGLPPALQANVESMSGTDLGGVAVHYNSPEPARVGAHAFAQGADIHVAPGQEAQVPHETWHVVQQAQNRVRPTGELAGGVKVNDDPSLEAEADRMGARAASMKPPEKGGE